MIVQKLKEFVLCAQALGRTPSEKWEIFWRLTKNVRVRFGLARYHPNLIYKLSTCYGVFSLRDNFGDVTNLSGLLYHNEYNINHLEENGVILDIGANIGLFAAWVAYHNPDKKIYCFEPLAENVDMIHRNCPDAVVSQIGLGCKRTRLKLFVDYHNIMASHVSTPWQVKEEEFDVIPLDEFTQQHEIDKVAFMKIDTEGMELDVLDGGHNTLHITNQVAMETHSTQLHLDSIQRLIRAGFSINNEKYSGKSGLVHASRQS